MQDTYEDVDSQEIPKKRKYKNRLILDMSYAALARHCQAPFVIENAATSPIGRSYHPCLSCEICRSHMKPLEEKHYGLDEIQRNLKAGINYHR